MSFDEYNSALKMGQREYRARLMRGEYPYLPNLDEILSYTNVKYETALGLCEVPLELIVGTKTKGRTNSFAANFMPLLGVHTEFGSKWIELIGSLKEEGLLYPIKAYEFRNRYYVLEGNKRVSVMKYLDAYSIPCLVTRVVPWLTDSKEDRIYAEYMDFYEITNVNYINFSEEGRFAKLLELIGTPKGETWTNEDRLDFSYIYTNFRNAFLSKGGGKLGITVGDALLAYVTVYGYADTKKKTDKEIRKDLTKIWDEFLVLTEEQSVELSMEPSKPAQSPTLYRNLLNLIRPESATKLKIAFFHEKTHKTSSWTYGHELGRMYLDNVFPGQIETTAHENIVAGENDLPMMEQAVEDGCKLIFTTSPVFIPASLKIAAQHPDVKVLNCSLNLSHPTLRTYYARMYEAKYLAGAIAGSLSPTNKIGYIANYPIYGMAANINAFALGARLVNPNAVIYLDWSTLKNRNVVIGKDPAINYIMDQDMMAPGNISRHFGLYCVDQNKPDNLAITVWHWGKLYEKIVRSVLDGTWKEEDAATGNRAINYWWGMSSGVIDLICSQDLPASTKQLVNLLRQAICTEELIPFSGQLRAQDGSVMNEEGQQVPPAGIITMDWLLDNVVGGIPSIADLVEEAQAVTKIQGLGRAQEADS